MFSPCLNSSSIVSCEIKKNNFFLVLPLKKKQSYPILHVISAVYVSTSIGEVNCMQEKINMKIRPLHDRVVVRRQEEERTSAGGIVIPDSAAEKPSRGLIVAVGNGKPLENGDTRSLAVKVGDVVLFGKYSGNEVKVGGEDLVVMREDDIMAIIEK